MAEITYQFEHVRELMAEPELPELIREHYEQSAVFKAYIQLDIDWPMMLRSCNEGILRTVTERTGGQLTGYMQWWLVRHVLTRSTLVALQGAWNKIGLLTPSENLLRAEGIVEMIAHIKVGIPRAAEIRAFHRMKGWIPTDEIFAKVL